MTRRVLKKIFQQRCNDYVSELLIWIRTRFVVHLVVGIHVADVVVGDQVHVTKLFYLTLPTWRWTTWRHVCQLFTNLNWSLPSLILQLKTGVKSTLTSLIKELGAILTFGIKNWLNLNLDWSWSTKTMKNIWSDGDADEPLSGDFGRGLGTTDGNKIVLSQELEKDEKIKPF